jgi:hypothetical protein
MQAPWLAEIDTEKHDCFISSSPSKWTNNKLGLVWLEQVLERCAKQKAQQGRDWHLLILDSHSSHLTFEFLEYCMAHRILVSVFLFEGALIGASSLGLASFFGSIIFHVCSYKIQQCSHHRDYLSSQSQISDDIRDSLTGHGCGSNGQ